MVEKTLPVAWLDENASYYRATGEARTRDLPHIRFRQMSPETNGSYTGLKDGGPRRRKTTQFKSELKVLEIKPLFRSLFHLKTTK